MQTHEILLSCITAVSVGIALSIYVGLDKIGSDKDAYVSQCLANNNTDYFNTEQLNQCVNSFEIYRVKE